MHFFVTFPKCFCLIMQNIYYYYSIVVTINKMYLFILIKCI